MQMQKSGAVKQEGKCLFDAKMRDSRGEQSYLIGI